MENLPKDGYLKFNDDTLQAVRKEYNLDKPGAMKQAVDILESWVKQQPHFTKKQFDRRYLELTIIVSKGSLERAKSRLDRACTFRTLMPDIFEEYDVRNDFAKDMKDITHAVLPKMTKGHDRVYFLRNTGKKFDSTLLDSFAKLAAMFAEYLRLHDYSLQINIILDYMDVNLMELSSKLHLTGMRQIMSLLMEGYGFRIKAIYVLSESKLVDMIVSILKQVVSAKIGNRIQVFKSPEMLQDIFDKDILPVEYGGSEKSLEKIQEEFLNAIDSKEFKAYLRDINTAKTDETRRQTDKFNEQYLGMPGSFRTLSVD